MIDEWCQHENATGIVDAGGNIIAKTCPGCGGRWSLDDEHHFREIEKVSTRKPKLSKEEEERKPKDWCSHPTMQDVKGEGGTVIARFCPKCRKRFAVARCEQCGSEFNAAIDGPSSKYCSAGCVKQATANRKKAKKIEEENRRRARLSSS